jgi:hypothetical protein
MTARTRSPRDPKRRGGDPGDVTEVLSRRPVRAYVRAGPVTATFLVVLLATHLVLALTGAFAPARAWSSTNVENLAHHPLGALATSPFFLGPGEVPTPGTVVIVAIGIGVALWWLEARRGPATAVTAFLGGHLGATAGTAPVIVALVRAGRYPVAVLSAVDVGISYGAQAATAAAVVLLPRWWSLAGALVVVAWPLLDADWYGAFPDFTTVGHLVAAGLGFAVGPVARRR